MTGPIYGRTITASPLRIVDDGLIICRSKQALKGKRGGSSMSLGISNDNGKTVSNTIEISFRSHLPRLICSQSTVISSSYRIRLINFWILCLLLLMPLKRQHYFHLVRSRFVMGEIYNYLPLSIFIKISLTIP